MNAATLTKLNALQENLKAVVGDGNEQEINTLLDTIAEDIADYVALRKAHAVMSQVNAGERTYSTAEVKKLLGLETD